MDPDRAGPELGDGELVDAVMRASRVLVAVAARSLAAAGDVSLPQYRVLVLLAGRGPLRAVDLAAALAINPSSATRLIDRLVRAGLVRRHRMPSDRRSYRIGLSQPGRALVAEVTRRRRQEFEQLLAAVPADRHRLVVAALQAVADAAGESPERDLAVGLGMEG
ncbi:MarR family winged helix-turn-helix transcriptional regulator [Pseudonocardia sp. DLS-67]